MYPFVKSQDQLSDEIADLEHASFGATVAKSVYDVLPDSYIQAAVANGTDKYISPDKQIDASTVAARRKMHLLLLRRCVSLRKRHSDFQFF